MDDHIKVSGETFLKLAVSLRPDLNKAVNTPT